MKTFLLLIITTILLSFSTAYFALNLQKNTPTADPIQIEDMRKAQIDFQNKTKLVAEIDLQSKFPSRDYFPLIQPIVSAFNRSTNLISECDPVAAGRMSKNYTEKKEQWNAYRCRELATLPSGFFKTAPFIHESGSSYAFLAYQLGVKPFNTESWIKANLPFFHISELRQLPPQSLDSNLTVLGTFDETVYDALLKGESPLLSKDFYLVKLAAEKKHIYRVYPRLDFEKYFNAKAFFASVRKPSDQCFFSEGNICFTKNSNDVLQRLRPSSMLIFGTSILILILVGLILYSRINLQNIEEERKRHALRVLTHELRTPISNLLLQVGRINKRSDLIATPVLEDLLKLEGEVYRLKRLAEKSSSYLHSQNTKKLITLEFDLVPSVNEFVADIVMDYGDRDVRFTPMPNDLSVELDIYWTRICIKNLIENAIHHGRPPVIVSTDFVKDILSVAVIDHGATTYPSLDSVLTLDGKSIRGSGLGMGLSLVKRIMQEMNGDLSYKANPTNFSIWLKVKS